MAETEFVNGWELPVEQARILREIGFDKVDPLTLMRLQWTWYSDTEWPYFFKTKADAATALQAAEHTLEAAGNGDGIAPEDAALIANASPRLHALYHKVLGTTPTRETMFRAAQILESRCYCEHVEAWGHVSHLNKGGRPPKPSEKLIAVRLAQICALSGSYPVTVGTTHDPGDHPSTPYGRIVQRMLDTLGFDKKSWKSAALYAKANYRKGHEDILP